MRLNVFSKCTLNNADGNVLLNLEITFLKLTYLFKSKIPVLIITVNVSSFNKINKYFIF